MGGAAVIATLTAALTPVAGMDDSRTCRIAWGTYVTGGPLTNDMAPVRAVDDAVGRHSRLVHWYVPWTASWGTFDYQHQLLDNIHGYASEGQTGSVPLLTWEPWGPPFQRDGTGVPLAGIARGDFDPYIDSWAAGLRSLGYPVLIDFAHEMNGNWYPWGAGVNGNTPDLYVAAFRHVHDRFAAASAGNVRFVWNPNNTSSGSAPVTAYYPGDAYVNWLAIDAYNSDGAWGTPYDQIGPIYQALVRMSPSKPIMLAEVGSQDQPPAGASPPDKAAWIMELARAVSGSFGHIWAVVWFDELNTELALDSSANALAAASQAFGGCTSQVGESGAAAA